MPTKKNIQIYLFTVYVFIFCCVSIPKGRVDYMRVVLINHTLSPSWTHKTLLPHPLPPLLCLSLSYLPFSLSVFAERGEEEREKWRDRERKEREEERVRVTVYISHVIFNPCALACIPRSNRAPDYAHTLTYTPNRNMYGVHRQWFLL